MKPELKTLFDQATARPYKFVERADDYQKDVGYIEDADNNDMAVITWNDGDMSKAQANARLLTLAANHVEALVEFAQATIARINGEWYNPALLKWGPLSTDAETDIKDFARKALSAIEKELS